MILIVCVSAMLYPAAMKIAPPLQNVLNFVQTAAAEMVPTSLLPCYHS